MSVVRGQVSLACQTVKYPTDNGQRTADYMDMD